MDKQIEVMEQKLVEFNGTELLGIKTNDGKIHVGVSYVCNGIGLTEGQKDRQVKKVQEDGMLKTGVTKLPVKFDGQVREVLVIEHDYLPIWLTKITITPKMQKDSPEVSQNLINYQLKSKDALSNAFMPQNKNVVQIPTELNLLGQISEAIQQSFKSMVVMQQEIVETKREVIEAKEENKQLKNEIQDVKNGLVDVNTPLRSQFNDAVKVYCGKQGLEFNIAYNNIYKILAEQHHVNIKLRAQRSGKKNIDILEELNLLVPAIRIAKTLGGVAS